MYKVLLVSTFAHMHILLRHVAFDCICAILLYIYHICYTITRPGKSGEFGNVILGKSDLLVGNFSQQHHQFFFIFMELTLWHPVAFEDSCAKTTRSHVALHVRNPGAKSGRELFKGSKDAASLLVCI